MGFKKFISGISAVTLMLTYSVLPEYNYQINVNAETNGITYSEEMRSSDFGYKKVDEDNDGNYDYVTITDFYDESANEIIIPNKIDGLYTMGIENFAFWRIENDLSVYISEKLDSKYIGKYAFITAAVTYQNAVLASGSDSLEGVLKYYLNNYEISYTDNKVNSYVDYATNIVKGSERDFDINSLSTSQFLTILFNEISLGKANLSSSNLDDFRFFLSTFSYKPVELISYYNRSNIKNGYAKLKVALKYKLLSKVSVPNAGVSLGNSEINQGDNEAILDINLDNISSKGLEIYVYCDSPLKIQGISNASNTEYSTEYGESCIRGKIIPKNNELLKNNAASVKLTIPDNIETGTYPVYIAVSYLKNEDGIFIKDPIAGSGSVIVMEKPVTTKPTETTTSTTSSEPVTAQSTLTTASVTVTSSTTTLSENFIWKKDNWNFSNSDTTLFSSEMDSNYSETLKKNATNIEWSDICSYLKKEQKNYSYGMSALSVLAKNGSFPYGSYTKDSNELFSIEAPNINDKVNSLINYYSCMRFKNTVQQNELKTMLTSNEDNIKNIISLLQGAQPVLIEYQTPNYGKNAVLAYDVTYGSWEKNGIAYDGRIELYDPNITEYDENRCIYFDKSKYNWNVPAYNADSANNAIFTLILSDVNIINDGGYLNGASYESTDSYYSKSEIIASDDNYEINKVKKTDNNIYTNAETDGEEIVSAYFYDYAGKQEAVKGYILKDPESAYKFSQTTPAISDLGIRYKNVNYNVEASAGNEFIFDPIGYVGIKGQNTQYSLNMIFDKYYPTDWYCINISGAGTDDLSLTKSEKGYFMNGSNFKDVIIKANNDDSSAQFKFSTDYKQVYIYEINKTTIGVSVDTDNDGIFETKLENDLNKSYILGDISGNGSIDIYDAIIIAESIIGKRKFNEEEFIIADINCDKKVNLRDAIEIAKLILKNNKK